EALSEKERSRYTGGICYLRANRYGWAKAILDGGDYSAFAIRSRNRLVSSQSMTIRQTIGNVATQGRFAQLLPAGVRNRAFRMLINDLTRQAKQRANSQQIFGTAPVRCDRRSSLKVASLVSAQD